MPGAQEQMHMVAQQGPGVAGGGRSGYEIAQPIQKGFKISGILENRLTFYPTDDDVMNRPGGIYAGFSRLSFS